MSQTGNVQQRNRNTQGVKKRESVNVQNSRELQIINVQRNPYLVEFDAHRKTGKKQDVASKQPELAQSRAKEQSRLEITESKSYRSSRAQSHSIVQSHSTVQSNRTVQSHSTARGRRVAERRRRRQRRRRALMLLGCACTLILCIFLYRTFFEKPQVDGSIAPEGNTEQASGSAFFGQKIQGLKAVDYYKHPAWTEDFLTVNEYSRPGDALKKVNNIFVHYTANRNTSAAQNRSYFEQLKDTHERSASAHFIIGYEGEIIQCVPLDEIAYAVAGRNEDSISIECCYQSEDGSFTQETYDSLLAMLKWLTDVYDLEEEDILRHYDCGGKKCPVYYVEHEEAWEQLKKDVGTL